MTNLSINLLGTFQVILNNNPITTFTTKKSQALLAYLAVEHDRLHSRQFLAGLLWPTSSEHKANQNLRSVLSNLRRTVGSKMITPPAVMITRRTARFDFKSARQIDVFMLEQLFEECQQSNSTNLNTWKQIISLYRGDFLAGFSFGNSVEFEEWILLKQNYYRDKVLEVFNWLSDYYEDKEQYKETLHYAYQKLNLDPWQEEAHRQVMSSLARCGQRNAALNHYQEYCITLAEELNTAPSAKTIVLYQQIERGEWIDKRNRQVSKLIGFEHLPNLKHHNLPTQLTLFIGRTEEQAIVAEYLRNDACRLVTISGMGGIGKTRLAVQVGEQFLSAFKDGVYFIPLASIRSADLLTTAIGNVLLINFMGQRLPQDQLLDFLRSKNILLILDNFEHLMDSVDLLMSMLRTSPNLKLLVTSRERLNLRAEWLLQIEGLLYPLPNASLNSLMSASAVRLFVQCARQVKTKFALTIETGSYIVRLCQLLEGLPLGIELAAAQISMNNSKPALSYHAASAQHDDVALLRTIIHNVETNIAHLATDWHDMPARHLSIRAVFESSWELLSDIEQTVLAQISIFRGGFYQSAAVAITNATPNILTALVHKSLLRQTTGKRYEIHELLRQFAKEKRTPHLTQSVRQRHTSYYLLFVSERQTKLNGKIPQTATAEIRTDLDNIRQAWHWAIKLAYVDLLGKSCHALSQFYDLRGLFNEGITVFATGIDHVRSILGQTSKVFKNLSCLNHESFVPPGKEETILAQLLVAQAHLFSKQGSHDKAITIAQESVQLAEANQNVETMTLGYLEWGWALQQQGKYDIAQAKLEQALELARTVKRKRLEAESLRGLATSAMRQNKYTIAKKQYEQSLAIYRHVGDIQGEGQVLNGLGTLADYQGEYTQVTTYYHQALQIYHKIGDRHGEGRVLSNLGVLADRHTDYANARKYYEHALHIFQDIGDLQGQANVLGNLGRTADDLGNYISALKYTEQALHIQREVGSQYQESVALANLALHAHHLDDNSQAKAFSEQALQIAHQIGGRDIEGYALLFLGHAYFGLENFDSATQVYQESLAIWHELLMLQLVTETLASLAYIYFVQRDFIKAKKTIEPILIHLENHTLDGSEEPFRIYLICYRILKVNNDDRAKTILEQAHLLLHAKADKIRDDELRSSFLKNVHVNHEIDIAWHIHHHETPSP